MTVSPILPSALPHEEGLAFVQTVRDFAIFLLDPAGRVASWNEGAQAIKGYAAGEIIGRHFSRFYPQEAIDRGWPDQELKLAQARGRFEDEGWRVRKDGTTFWANVVITALHGPDGALSGFLKITRDLTERRRQEEGLRRSEERFRLLVESVKDYAIFMIDADGRVMSWNGGARRIKGYEADEIIGRHFSVFYPADAVQRGWPETELRYARIHGRFEDEGWRVRKDGTTFWAEVVITPVLDGQGVLRGYAKVTRDLSERKRIESLESSQRQLHEFLAMLAHELRNPLAPVSNAISVLLAKGNLDAESLWICNMMRRQMAHLTRLVDDLLDASRVTRAAISLRMARIDLVQVARQAIESSRSLLEERHHHLEARFAQDRLEITGDETRLLQVMVNLLQNAAKYTPNGGHIVLSLDCDGGQAVIRVQDDGMGISPELLPTIFDLFVQGDRGLERSEGGLGIGLTLVKQLVALHGGSVTAESPGRKRGALFTVRLPLNGAEGEGRAVAHTRA